MKGQSTRSSLYIQNIMSNSLGLSSKTGEQCQTQREAEELRRLREES